MRYKPKTVLDMGGTGRMRKFVACPVTDANIRTGINATNLPYKDNSFDITVSVATIEHVKDQRKFLEEAYRVARKGSIHWFPAGQQARLVDKFKLTKGWKHPAIIPDVGAIEEIVRQWPYKLTPNTTCREHLLLLSTIHRPLNCMEMYHFIPDGFYGYLLELTK